MGRGQGGRKRILVSEPRAPSPPHTEPSQLHQRISNKAGRAQVSRSTNLRVVTPHLKTKTGTSPWPRPERTFHALGAGQPALAQPTWRLLGHLSPSPSTRLGCIPPPQMGHKPFNSTAAGHNGTHTRECDEARGEPTALGYLHPVPPENWSLPSAILKTLQSPSCGPERQA